MDPFLESHEGDAHTSLTTYAELQPLVAQAWTNGGYADIGYAAEPLPPFSAADTEWIEHHLIEHGYDRAPRTS